MTMGSKVAWQTIGDEKRTAVRDLFAEIAPRYDVMNSIISLRFHHRWRSEAASFLALRPGQSVLDLCCGTGDFASALRSGVGETGLVVGADFCSPMLQIAQEKKLAADALVASDACRLPFANESFDAVAVGWGIRNVANTDGAHREIYRILKPGGRFVSVDMAEPQSPVVRVGSRFVFHRIVPLIGGLFGKKQAYTYLPKSTERFMNRDQLCDSMRQAGFSETGWKNLFMGQICIHWGGKS